MRLGFVKAAVRGGGLGVLMVAAAWSAPAALAQDEKARVEQVFTEQFQSFPGFDALPEADRPRAVKCIVDSFLADIPQADASRLADMLERKVPADKALLTRWLIIDRKSNPERHAQLNARSAERCPDLMKVLDAG